MPVDVRIGRMQVKSIPSTWLDREGRRLDCGPYMSGAIEAKVLLAKLPVQKEPLHQVTAGYNGGIYNGPQFVRNYIDEPTHGVPFLTGGSMLQADLSSVPLLRRKDAESSKLSYLRLQTGMTLISCSGTIGRMVFTRPDMEGMWSSQDILKVVPDPDKILPGYLYAYLSSRFGVPLIVSGTYGAIIQHIEPQHIANLPVPRLGRDIEEQAHQKIVGATQLRSEYQMQIKTATDRLFEAVGLKDITSSAWHAMGSDVGFAQVLTSSESLRALNFNPRFQGLLTDLASKEHEPLGNICAGGQLRSGLRFKRIDCEPSMGAKLVGQRELFWMEPEGRWISTRHAPDDIFVEDETILIAAQGTLGENEVFCRAELITGPWLQQAYSQHFLRVRSGTPEVSGAFLFAFLRSEIAFRCLRSISVGSKQQDLHRAFLARLPIPLPSSEVRQEIEHLVRTAFQSRHEASALERAAVALVEAAIEEG